MQGTFLFKLVALCIILFLTIKYAKNLYNYLVGKFFSKKEGTILDFKCSQIEKRQGFFANLFVIYAIFTLVYLSTFVGIIIQFEMTENYTYGIAIGGVIGSMIGYIINLIINTIGYKTGGAPLAINARTIILIGTAFGAFGAASELSFIIVYKYPIISKFVWIGVIIFLTVFFKNLMANKLSSDKIN